MSIENGGPAFPEKREVGTSGEYRMECESGMTLRDYFAAKAMQVLIRRAPAQTSFGAGSYTNLNYAKESYAMADAMIEARQS